jgi:hypothetical protein
MVAFVTASLTITHATNPVAANQFLNKKEELTIMPLPKFDDEKNKGSNGPGFEKCSNLLSRSTSGELSKSEKDLLINCISKGINTRDFHPLAKTPNFKPNKYIGPLPHFQLWG